MKKKSTYASGNQAEIWVRGFLLKAGYSVHRCLRSFFRTEKGIPLSHSNDLFHCIDIVAIKPEEKTLWIQVTKSSGIGKKLEKLKLVEWNFEHSDVQVWQNVSSGRWRLLRFNGEALITMGEIQRGKKLLEIREEEPEEIKPTLSEKRRLNYMIKK